MRTKRPIEAGLLVPWMAYSLPRSVSAAAPIGLRGEPLEMTGPRTPWLMARGARQAGSTNLGDARAGPLHARPPNGDRKAQRPFTAQHE